MRGAAAAVLVAAWLTSAAPTAGAHSLLLGASPAPDSVLVVPPERVVLRFNNRIEKKLSRLTLIGERGQRRVLALAAGGPPDELAAPLPRLDGGQWRLDWSVLSTDGHLVSGGYSFRVFP